MNLTSVFALLRREMGLNPTSVGEGTVAHALRRRMAAVACTDEQDYATRLSASPEELQELIEEVSVPETWFFREEHAFACLRDHLQQTRLTENVRPRLIACLPCATGEEAYSIAMALLDTGLSPNKFRVHALDISYRALLRAQQGLYGEYSFRAADKSFRARHFKMTAESYQITEAVRAQVSFYQGSALILPPPFNALTYDAVFCRNLLIYLHAEARQRVVAGLKAMLAPDGILLVGHSEVSILLHEGFFRSPNGALRYRQEARQEAMSTVPPPHRRQRQASGTLSTTDSAPPPAPMPFATTTAAPITDVTRMRHGGNADELSQIRSLADAGQLEEASARCTERILAGLHSAELYCLQGLIWNAQGNTGAARECFRKALYLDPQHGEAHWQLSLVDQRHHVERRAAGERVDHDDRRKNPRHDR